MKPSEIIDKALTEVIPTEEQWWNGCGAHNAENTQHCIVGAISMAMGEEAGHVHHQALEAIRLQVREFTNDTGSALGYFNTKHTFEEVRTVMEKARAQLQEEGR